MQTEPHLGPHCHLASRNTVFLSFIFNISSGRKHSHTNSHVFVMTLITQDDHLTAGAWAACGTLRGL